MTNTIYQISPTLSISDLTDQFKKCFSYRTTPARPIHRHYLDTRDWRLLREGLYLRADKEEDEIRLRLFTTRNNRLVTQTSCQALPTSKQEFPPGKLGDLLSPILAQRPLIDQIQLEVRHQALTLLDSHDKRIAHFAIENIHPKGKRGKQAAKSKTLQHQPTRGHDRENREIANQLQHSDELLPLPCSEIETWLDRLGINHHLYSCKSEVDLDPAARIDISAKKILLGFLDAIQANRPGVVDDIDSECLHDLRIAVRRSRTLLSEIPEIIPERTLKCYKTHLAHLGHITTPQRDLDVMLINFDHYREMLPKLQRSTLDAAYRFIAQERQGTHLTVKEYLTSDAYRRFIRGWRRYLESPSPARRAPANADRPTRSVADQYIWKTYKHILEQGRAIKTKSPPETLHELRKDCKKLRYLIEFFDTLYPKGKTKKVIHTMKKLQDLLGEYQDLHVHLAFFADLQQRMRKAHMLPTETDRALTTIQKAFKMEQQLCSKHFHNCFDAFDSKAHHSLFHKLFKP